MPIVDPKGTPPINKTTVAKNEANLPTPTIGEGLIEPPAETPAPPMGPSPPQPQPPEPDGPVAEQNRVD